VHCLFDEFGRLQRQLGEGDGKAQEVAELNEAIAKAKMPVCTENLIRVDDVMESLKLAE
jgi:ATP-dependent Lon protease